ncbi:fibronectin-like, partial [Saccoglossus kowalevskii]
MQDWRNTSFLPTSLNMFTFTNLSVNVEYTVHLLSVSADRTRSKGSNEIVFTTEALPLPIDVEITDVSDEGASISWVIPEEDGYLIGSVIVHYKPDGSNEWQNVTVASSDNSVDLINLEPNTTYTIQVAVTSTDGQHSKSTTPTSFTTLADLLLPYNISIISIGTREATVTWLLDLNTDISGSVVQYKPTNSMQDWRNTSFLPTSLNMFTLTNLSVNVEYTVRLLSVTADQTRSKGSNEIVFTTEALPLPRDVEITDVSDEGAFISWVIPEEDGDLIGSVIVHYKPDGSNEWQNVTVASSVNSIDLINLKPNTTYTIQVAVTSTDGQHSKSTTPTSFTTLADLLLPYNISIINIGTREATVTWLLDLNSDISGSVVQYKPTNSMQDWRNTSFLPTSLNMFTFTNLSVNVEYTVRLLSVSADRTRSKGSNEIVFTTEALPLPIDVEITDVSDEGASISWVIPEEDGDLIGSVIVHYKLDGSNEWQNVTVASSDNSVDLINLEPNTTYTIQVAVTSTDGQHSKSTTPTSFTTLADLLLPYNISIINIGTREATVTWLLDLNSDISGSVVQYKPTNSMQDWRNTSFLPTSLNMFTLTNLSVNVEYTVRLLSVTVDQTRSKGSNEIVFTTEALPLPRDVEITDVSDEGASISWVIPEEDGDLIGSVIVHYMPDGSNEWQNVTVASSDNSVDLINLNPNTTYTIQVAVTSTDGQHSKSTTPTSFTTLADLLLPYNISIISIGTREATVTWLLDLNTDISGSVVQYKPTNSMQDWRNTSFLPTSLNMFTLTNLSVNVEYTVRLLSVSADRTRSKGSNEIVFTTEALPLPIDVEITDVSDEGASISWVIPEEDGDLIGSVIVHYKPDGSNEWQNVTVASSDNSVDLINLEPNTTYTIQVAVTSTDGQHSKSTTPTSFTTLADLLLPYNISIINIGTREATVTWLLDLNSDISGSVVQYKPTNSMQDWRNTSFLPTSLNMFTFTNLSVNVEYTVRLLSVSADRTRSKGSNEIVFTTEALPLPIDVEITDVSDEGASISWVIPEEDGDLIGSVIVHYKPDGSNEWQNVTVASSDNSVDLINLEPNTTYTIQVAVTSTDGQHSKSTTPTSFTTLADLLLPYNISIISIGTREATVTWLLDLNSDISGSVVQYKPTNSMQDWRNTSFLPTSLNMFTLTNLSVNVEYTVRLLSVTADQTRSKGSNEIVFTTEALPLPRDVEITDVSDEGASISWVIPEEDGDLIGSVIVHYKPDGSNEWQNVTVASSDNSVDLINLKPNTTYTIQVAVTSTDGQHSKSTTPTSFTTLADLLLPYNISIINIGTREATVTWLLDLNSDISGSVVQYKPTNSMQDWRNTSFLPTSLNMFTFTNLSVNVEYTVRLLSVSADRTRSKGSNEIVFTTEALPLPIDVEITDVSDEGASISWVIPEEDGDLIGSVIVHYKPDGSNEWQNVTVASSDNSVDLINLEPNTTYTIQVAVTSTDGQHSKSTTPTSFTTLA